jgi:UDP-glucose 4-epimerase
VYRGRKDTLLKEVDEKECKTIYAINKLACETYLRIYHECFGVHYTVFRICVPYGNTVGQSLSYGSIRHFFLQAKEKKNVIVYGDGLQKRTFTHVTDIARILVSGGLDKRTDNEVFNIGGPDQLAIVDVATKIAEKYGVGVDFRDWNELDRKTESGDTMFDSSKLDKIVPPDYTLTFDEWIESDPTPG